MNTEKNKNVGWDHGKGRLAVFSFGLLLGIMVFAILLLVLFWTGGASLASILPSSQTSTPTAVAQPTETGTVDVASTATKPMPAETVVRGTAVLVTPTSTVMRTAAATTTAAAATMTSTPTATYTPTPTATHTPTPTATHTPTSIPTSTPEIVDWRGEYYDNSSLLGSPVLVRNDSAPGRAQDLVFNWDYRAPAPELPADRFSARWTRRLAFEEGLYRFFLSMDDGARLYVDGQLVIDDWRPRTRRTATADVRLDAREHDLRVEYYEGTGVALLELRWQKLTSFPDWKGQYWSNPDLQGGPALVRNDSDPNGTLGIDANWGQGSPGAGVPADNFSARWTRALRLQEGTYRFYVQVDDGARLWVDNRLVIDAWYDHSLHELTAEVVLQGGEHQIRLEYYDHRFNAQIRMWWQWMGPVTYPDWKGQYWSNPELEEDPVLVRNDPRLDFDWGEGSPDPSVPVDRFSARWTRTIDVEPGTYRFHVFVDDGARLWVDQRLVIDAWYDHSLHELTGDVVLGAGEHRIQLDYYEQRFKAVVSLWWAKIAPPHYPDWKGEYWSNPDLAGDPLVERNDAAVDFAWGQYAPATVLPEDHFSARWTREWSFVPGKYRFYGFADDGLRLYLDGELVLNEWHEASNEMYTIDVPLSGKRELRVEYYEHTGDAQVRLWWRRTSDLDPIPH